MSEVRYGPVIGNYNTIMFPVTDSQKFHPNGGAFVFLDSSGFVSIALTATQSLFGWAMVPRSLAGAHATLGYWTSGAVAVAGTSYVPVIVAAMNLGVTFRVPCGTGLAVATECGEAGDIILTSNNGTVQSVGTATSTHDVVLMVGLPEDGDTNSLLVTFNPNEIQRDTA